MAVWVISGRHTGPSNVDRCAVMLDSVTMTAFGPVFEDADECEDFQAWCVRMFAGDPRKMTDDVLGECVLKFRETRE